jgi:hypothetical protein
VTAHFLLATVFCKGGGSHRSLYHATQERSSFGYLIIETIQGMGFTRAEQAFFSVRAQHNYWLPKTKILNTQKPTCALETVVDFYNVGFFFIQKLIA